MFGNQKGELYISDSVFFKKDKSEISFDDSIRDISQSVDNSKVLISVDNFNVYLYDLSKGKIENSQLFEGHSDIVTGVTSISNSLTFATW